MLLPGQWCHDLTIKLHCMTVGAEGDYETITWGYWGHDHAKLKTHTYCRSLFMSVLEELQLPPRLFYMLQLTALSHPLLISAHLWKVSNSSPAKTVKTVSVIGSSFCLSTLPQFIQFSFMFMVNLVSKGRLAMSIHWKTILLYWTIRSL